MSKRIKRARIYRDLSVSRFRYTTLSKSFVFSSLFYLQKFDEKLDENREYLKNYFKSRFNIEFCATDYFDIILYASIEKRGFHVEDVFSREVWSCLNHLKLDGEIRTIKKFQEL